MSDRGAEKGGKLVLLAERYDMGARQFLLRNLRQEHEKYRDEFGYGASRRNFLDYLKDVIRDFRYEGGIISLFSNGKTQYELPEVSDKTIYNFSKLPLADVGAVKLETLQIIDAFLQCSYYPSPILRRGAHASIRELGRATRIQYFTPEMVETADNSLEELAGIYVANTQSIYLPGPRAARSIVLWVSPVRGEGYVVCRLVPLAKPLASSHVVISGPDFSDWGEDHFVGFGISSRDGYSCHMTSISARIPLYILIRKPASDADDGLVFTILSYSSAGYTSEYIPLERTLLSNINSYFDKLGWVV